jgi:hypothetical protein
MQVSRCDSISYFVCPEMPQEFIRPRFTRSCLFFHGPPFVRAHPTSPLQQSKGFCFTTGRRYAGSNHNKNSNAGLSSTVIKVALSPVQSLCFQLQNNSISVLIPTASYRSTKAPAHIPRYVSPTPGGPRGQRWSPHRARQGQVPASRGGSTDGRCRKSGRDCGERLEAGPCAGMDPGESRQAGRPSSC